jgi:hypothetical protein
MRQKISWKDGRTDRGKTVYPPPPSGSGGINTYTTQNIPLLQAHINLISRCDAVDCRFYLIKGQLKLVHQNQQHFTLFNLIRGITLEPDKT